MLLWHADLKHRVLVLDDERRKIANSKIFEFYLLLSLYIYIYINKLCILEFINFKVSSGSHNCQMEV